VILEIPSPPLSIPLDARCVGCGYSLYQLQIERCPECGKSFDLRDPVSMGLYSRRRSRNLERLRRPHSRFAFALPWILAGLILIAPVIPYALGYVVVGVGVIWFLMFIVQLPDMLARKHPANQQLFSLDLLQADKRLWNRMIKALSVSVLLMPFIPVCGLVVFFLFQSKLNQLAAQVPPAPVSYREFGTWRIGPFSPDGIDRMPHELDIGIMPSEFFDTHRSPWATGTVFVLEDDPGYSYDNTLRFHLRGQWYVEYRF
jgi:hypothetical protein